MKPRGLPSSKTQFVVFVATSVDGRISLTKKTLPDWTSKEDWSFFQKSLQKFDAVIVGRNTYQAAATRLRQRTTFVLSSRISTSQRRGTVTFLNPARVDIKQLLKQYKRVAVLGGAMVYRTMLERGLLDELYITIEPLIFGRGQAMVIGGTITTQLRLISQRRLNKAGTLLLHYKIKRLPI